MAEYKPTYKDLEQRIALLEQELLDKNERILLLQEKAIERERNIQDITSNFETFFNTIDNFLFVLDEHGYIIHCNNTVEKRLGYPLEELKGKSVLSLHPEERRSEVAKVIVDVIAGKLASFQIPLVTKQGKQIYVETLAKFGVWNGKPSIFGVSKDITQLKLSEEKFSTAFYLNPSACSLSEADTGRFIEVNDAFSKLFGYTREEIIGYNALELQIMTEKTRDDILLKADSLGRIFNAEAELKTRNGEVKRVLLSGQNIYIQDFIYRYTIVHDVTEVHKAKEIAEENEQKFSMLLNACPEPLSVTTIEEGRFVIINEAFLKASGFEREGVLNHKTVELDIWLSVDDREKWVNELVKKGSVRGAEIQFRTKKHGIRDFLISSDIIEFDKKKCALNFYIDITDRKTAELELLKAKEKAEESESKFKNLYEALSISYLILKDGVCIECNEATLSIYGANSKEEVIGKSPLDFSPEFQLNNLKTSEEANRQIQTTIEKGAHTFEWIALRNNKKEEFFAEVSLSRFYYKGELHIQCLTTDITERKKIEAELIAAKERAEKNERNLLVQNHEYEIVNEELRQTNEELITAKEKIEESEQNFKNLYESLSIAYLIIKDGVCVECNKAALEIYGVEGKDEIIGKPAVYFSPEFQSNNVRSVDEAIRQSQIAFEKGFHSFEWIAMRKNKETFINEVSLKPFYYKNELYFQCLTTDITERKKYESEIIAAKDKAEEVKMLLQNIADNIPAFIAAVDAETLEYKFVNNQYATSFGKDKNEIIGSHISKIIGQRNFEFALEYLNKVKQGQPSSYINTFDLVEGKRFASVNYVQGYNEKGEFDKIIVLTYDITELKNTEAELIKAKEKAEESDHLKTAFLQNVSHEIRTPLNAICGFSDFLSNEDLPVDKRKNFVQIIQNSSSQLLSIVNDVLAISSLETKQAKISLSAVCLNTLIVEILAIFKQQAKNRNIALYTTHQLTDKQSEVYTDRTKITQILSNLLSNALKFTHTGSIEYGYSLINNEIEFYVKDSGIGVKPELHEKIFERFRQADSTIQVNYGGTGLGLSICKGFVELLGGKIWVQSEIDKGSTFYFTLPYKPVNEIYDAISPGKQNKNFKTVLVAEDDEYNFLFIEELLIHFNLKLIHAKTGEEAVEIFRSNPQIDFVLMDIKMPIMDGYEAAKFIKSTKPDLPIVAQTAYAIEYERIKYEGVFDDYLTKPIKGEILTEIMSKFLDVKR